MAVWVCERCNSNNSMDSTSCEICGYERSKESIKKAKAREREETLARRMTYINNVFLGKLYKITKIIFVIDSIIAFVAVVAALCLKHLGGHLDDIWLSSKMLFPIVGKNIHVFSDNLMAIIFCNFKLVLSDKVFDNTVSIWNAAQHNFIMNCQSLANTFGDLCSSAKDSFNVFLQVIAEIYQHLCKHFN